MASLSTWIARRAHHIAADLSKQTIRVGATLPNIALKDVAAKESVQLNTLSGKNVIVGVPGAFSPACSNQVPGFIESYEKFKAKGVNDIYVVAVNDSFVMKAWKEHMAAKGTPVKFLSDPKAEFVAELGLAFDADAAFGGVRAKRFALVTDSGKVTKVAVEESPGNVDVSAADSVLKDI